MDNLCDVSIYVCTAMYRHKSMKVDKIAVSHQPWWPNLVIYKSMQKNVTDLFRILNISFPRSIYNGQRVPNVYRPIK